MPRRFSVSSGSEPFLVILPPAWVIGPVLHLIGGSGEILAVAELGVVLLLFIIGLELMPTGSGICDAISSGLEPVRWLLTGLVLSGIVMASGLLDWRGALVAGFGLAFSLPPLRCSSSRLWRHETVATASVPSRSSSSGPRHRAAVGHGERPGDAQRRGPTITLARGRRCHRGGSSP